MKLAFINRKIATSGAIGILLALVIIGTVSLLLPPATTGTLLLKITDAPADLNTLYLTIDSFEVHSKDTGWYVIPIEGGSISFDLLQLDGITLDAAIGDLDPGDYNMIQMHIVEGLEFTYATRNVENSEPFAINVPSEKLHIPVDFEIVAGDTTIVILDILADAEWRMAIANNPEHNFNPVIRPIVIPPISP